MFLKLRIQVVLNNLIDGLHLVVCLRMINRKEAFLDAKLIAKFPKILVIKLCAII